MVEIIVALCIFSSICVAVMTVDLVRDLGWYQRASRSMLFSLVVLVFGVATSVAVATELLELLASTGAGTAG